MASRRLISRNLSSLPIKVSEEVRQALNDKTPLVSLESTIITHGLPYPANLAMAKDVEDVIRSNGCVPATMAFIDGEPLVGLNDTQLEYLSTAKQVHKTSRRDIPYVMAERLVGGTTISSTMILSKLAGIRVFATGGLGGVHKNGESTMDISADLDELSKTDVAVVCSGPKAILDIERTIEYLETKGVPVTTYNPKRKSTVYIPGFYCEESKTLSPFQFTDFKQPANMIHQGMKMQLDNGYLICIPPPDELAMDKDFIYNVIDEAQAEAERLGVKGKQVTPFLLGKINAETDGKSVKSNVGFVLNNAKSAAEIAKQLNALQNEADHTSFQPSTKIIRKPHVSSSPTQRDKSKALIIGSIAVDSTCILKPGYKLKDSNPGISKQTIGGVGLNVTLAATFAGSNIAPNENTRLVSILGSDALGDKILADLQAKGVDNTGFYKSDTLNTAQYISIHGDDGSLIVACADMDIIEHLPTDHLLHELKRADPDYVLMDSNVTPVVMDTVISESKRHGYKIVVEPTSVIKASRIAHTKLGVWPENEVMLATPTCEELATMYEAFESQGKFDDLDQWFNILDRTGLDSMFRNELDSAANKSPFVKQVLQKGILQQAFKLLPYIPNLVIKDGKNGILVVQLVTNANELTRSVLKSTGASFSAVTRNGKLYEDEDRNSKQLGILVQHYPIPEPISQEEIKNVTGAGDSMVGYLFSKLGNGDKFLEVFDSQRESVLKGCQVAAGLSLKCEDAVNLKAIADVE